jgi:hypothetical protein
MFSFLYFLWRCSWESELMPKNYLLVPLRSTDGDVRSEHLGKGGRTKYGAEQIMIVLDGYIDEIIEGKLYRAKKDDVLILPSDIEHGGYIGDVDCNVIDIFSPPRDDYLEKFGETFEKPAR